MVLSNYTMRRDSMASSYRTNSAPLCRGPLKVIFFCMMAVFFPIILITIPLLMRFVILGSSIYHLSPSDMRILDQKISTVWCQSEYVKMNTSFTAYLSEGEPQLIHNETPLTITKNLLIPDDQKEFWGFYLLKGSTFRVSTCARWKGGSLLIVKGREDLEYCAYTGEQDSLGHSDEFFDSESEELEQFRKNQSEALVRKLFPRKFSEERSILLSRIKGYIRHPEDFEKLKEKLADWMISTQKNATNYTESLKDIENTLRARREIQPDVQGYIRRKRRQKRNLHLEEYLRKLSESGENGAFEEIDNEIEDGTFKTLNDSELIREHNLHEGIFNLTTENDGSNSESESSYSSSEEALAKCRGVIQLAYLKPNEDCDPQTEDFHSTFSYHVNVSGYYYIIYGSENEIRDNFIRARFELDKTEYSLPEPVENCTNIMECSIELGFASDQKLVVQVPKPSPEREDIWDNDYVAHTDCEPRASLYFLFAMTVPILIIIFAFQ